MRYSNTAVCEIQQSQHEMLDNLHLATAHSRCSSMTSLLSQLNWPSLQLHRDQSSLIIFFKIIHNLVNIPHSFLHSPPYSTHCPNKFIHLHSRTELFKNSFFPRTIRLWNCLSESIREVNNLENFV